MLTFRFQRGLGPLQAPSNLSNHEQNSTLSIQKYEDEFLGNFIVFRAWRNVQRACTTARRVQAHFLQRNTLLRGKPVASGHKGPTSDPTVFCVALSRSKRAAHESSGQKASKQILKRIQLLKKCHHRF